MNDLEGVPFLDLSWQHARIAEQVDERFARVLANTNFILGPEVAAFESEFASFCEVDHTVGVGNGTDALEIALAVSGVGPGDEVIIPANTFVATAEAVARAGAKIVLADCADDFLIDPEEVAQKRTAQTRAVIPVHLYGQTASVELLRAAVGPDIVVIEDAAQAQGARRHGRRAGSLGDIAATSFYPGKNLGAYGDAGAVMTKSRHLSDLARGLRNHGGERRYEHLEIGRNSRLDELQAAVLRIKLATLDKWNQERRDAAARYGEWLADLAEVQTPFVGEHNEHVFHLYVVRVPERNRVLHKLEKTGIGAGIHYPTPVHLLPAFGHLGIGIGDLPVAETASAEVISLPMFPGITIEQQERVVEALQAAVRGL